MRDNRPDEGELGAGGLSAGIFADVRNPFLRSVGRLSARFLFIKGQS